MRPNLQKTTDFTIITEEIFNGKRNFFLQCQEQVAQCIHGKVNKITLSANDIKRLHMFDQVISYPYATGPGRVFKTELMIHLKTKIEYDD